MGGYDAGQREGRKVTLDRAAVLAELRPDAEWKKQRDERARTVKGGEA